MNMVAKPRVFYGWRIVIAGTLATMLSSSLGYYGFSAFFPAIEKEFDWSRTAISGAFSLSRIESGVLGPLEGYLIQRLGVRRMMIAGVLLLSLGFILFSQVKSLFMFYLVVIFGIALGSSLGFHMPVSFAVANWFRRKRGRAFGIFRSGSGLGGLLVPLVGLLIVTLGWRSAAVIAGVSVVFLVLPLALVMRSRPQDYGLLPDGDVSLPEGQGLSTSTQRTDDDNIHAYHQVSFTTTEALRTPAFWLMSLAMLVTSMTSSGVVVHFVVMLQDRGVDVAIGSALLGSLALMTAPGRFGFTWLSDYLDKRLLLASLMGVLGVAVFCMAQVENAALFALLTAVFALTYGGALSVIEPMRADYFGVEYFATIMGCMRLIQAVGHFVGPLLAGLVYDSTSSYSLAFTFFAGCVLLGTLFILFSKKPSLSRNPK